MMQKIIDRCLARSNTYNFLSRLYLQGPVPELYAYIEAVPELARTLAEDENNPGSIKCLNQDHLAADHYHIFGLNVLPYESAFLEPDNVLAGAITEGVFAAYRRAGFNPDMMGESADHIGLALKFLADLCRTQAETEVDQRIDLASQMEAEQVNFLENHLLRWLPGFVQAVHQQNNPFYTSTADITLDVVIDHYQDRSGGRVLQYDHIVADFQLPAPPEILLNERTGLRDISRYLLTPVFSGVYFSREIIESIARNQNLPRGFGDRETILTNLFRNAVDYDQLTSVLDAVNEIFNQWLDFYDRLSERYHDPNLLEPYLTPWLARIHTSQQLLNDLHSAASAKQKNFPYPELV